MVDALSGHPRDHTARRVPSRRILVIGPGGSGKTTLTRDVAHVTGLPAVHLDAHYWRPGWNATPDVPWSRRVAELLAEPAWVMDGNYGSTLEMRMEAADTIVFLDEPRGRCVRRVLGRWLTWRGRVRPGMAEGCPERITWAFLVWIWTYRKRRRPRVLARLRSLSSKKQVLVMRTAEQRRDFIEGLRPGASRGP